MSVVLHELNDDRILGVEVIEVLSFPNVTILGNGGKESFVQMTKNFEQLLTELYKLGNHSTALEILWISEAVENQTFAAKIRIFFVLRNIGKNKETVQYILGNLRKNLIHSLAAMNYVWGDENAESNILQILERVNDGCVYSLVKSEKCVMGGNLPYSYYYADVIPEGNTNNFVNIVAALSQNPGCALSFQLFPTSFTQREEYLLQEVFSETARIAGGVMAGNRLLQDESVLLPRKTYGYYLERKGLPLFLYNILVMGNRTDCAGISAALVSLLQSGENGNNVAGFSCFDISEENICLRKQFPYYVWNVNQRMMQHYRRKDLLQRIPLVAQLYRMPYLMTNKEAVSVFRLPLYEKTMPALHSNQLIQIQEQFSKDVIGENNIQFGKVITNDGAQVTIGCPEKYFTGHALVVGKPGQGKTTFVMNLLLQFKNKGIPFLAIEPTKAEYRAMLDAVPDLQVFTPGNNEVSPYIVNPFIPPKGVRVEQYIPSLINAFAAAFAMHSPLDMLFLKAVRTCYIRYGWKDYSVYGDEDVTVFGMQEFIVIFKETIESMGYSKEVRSNIESAGLLRLTSLFEQNRNIYDSIHTIPVEDLLSKPTVLELNAIDNMEQKALIMALLLISVCVYTKSNSPAEGNLRNIILIDEAHVLLEGKSGMEGKADPSETTIQMIRNMMVEIRSYGIGIIISDQMPSRVGRTIVANTEIKVAFQLVDTQEKELVAGATDMDEEMRNRLGKLQVGEAYVHYGKMESVQIIKTDDIRKAKGIRLGVSDGELAERETYWKNHRYMLKPYRECEHCDYCREQCDMRLRSKADYVAEKAFEQYRRFMKDTDTIKKCIYNLPELLKNEIMCVAGKEEERLIICSRIKLFRKVLLELPIKMNSEDADVRAVLFQLQRKAEEKG